ncbi:MAG TPA: ABC transporter substrate-binding protein [Methylomirabilota bacterium]|jgi:peptide/nickel transport system substrate-binding protein|nr:ABC transporter substrate-binding protein [Methylomirabilota bacterium]
MRRRFLLAVPAVSLLAALWLLPADAFGQTPKRGGVLRISDREPPNLDPHLNISFLTHSWANMVYSQLVRYPHGPEQKHSADFSIVGDLAEKWEYKSPTVLEFTLRKGVKFHNKPPVNGREVTAEDAKYSIERFKAKSAFRSRFDVVQSIDVVDRYTLRVTLKEPSAPFLNHLAASTYVAILPREVEEKFKDFNRPEAMIGTGPFMVKGYQKGVNITFERNPDYHMKGLPYLDGVVIEITPESSARLSLLRAGKVELGHMWGYAVPEEAKSLKQTNPEMVMSLTWVLPNGHIYFRTDQPPFNDVRVRRAIALAIDRKAWNDAIHYGEGCIEEGPVPCAMKDWKLPASKLDPAKAKFVVGYDPAEAKRLLAEAGHPNGFTTPMYHWPGYAPPWRTYYDLAADNLAKIGVKVEFKPEEYGKYITTTYLGKFDGMAIGPQLPGNEVDDWLFACFYPEQPHNRSHIADAELNKMLIAQRRELDAKKRLAIVHDIQRYLADKAYYVYLPGLPQYIAHTPQVKGFTYHDGFSLGYRLMFTWLEK